ncbi:MAG: P-loop NTPase fold protein [bacterium]
MDQTKQCRTKLIEDTVSDNDEFGAHDLVAKSLAELIETEPGGKAIALTGSWGSGKSTTINLLSKKLTEKNKEFKIFIFDAWSHRGDPLRRTFLEKLITCFENWFWLSGNLNSKNFLDDLARRRKVTDTKKTPHLTWQGKFLGVLIFLVPIGLALLSRIDDPNVCPLVPALGGLIALLPLLFILIFTLFREPICWVLKKINNFKIFKTRWLKNSCAWCSESESAFEIFLEKSTSTTKSETIETPDPTSVEFHNYFKALMNDVLKSEKRKLVIVVDNLDRIDPNDALSLWSTMKTFFDFSYGDNNKWQSNLWLIVPFDPSALNELWVSSSTNGEKERTYSNLAQSFVDKTFNITFAVPPTLLSDWHGYLMKQLKNAFPDHAPESDDFHNVYRVFRLNGAGGTQLPTPREIKNFVNSLGAIHRQWNDKIPLHLQALFVIKNRKGWKPIDYLVKQTDTDIQKEIPPEILPANWRGSLAAIYFNAPIEKALQILIGGRVEDAISSGNTSALVALKEIYGLTKEIESFIGANAAEWANKQPKTIALAAYSISSANFSDDSSLNSAWKILCSNAAKVSEWKNLDEPSGLGVVNLIEHENQQEFFQKILKSLSNSKSTDAPEGEIPDQKGVEQWLKGAGHVLRKLIPLNLQEEFNVAGSAWMYIHTIAILTEISELGDVQKYFIPSISKETVIEELAKRVTACAFLGKFTLVPTVLDTMGIAWVWDPLISQIQTRIIPQNNVPNAEIRGCLLVLHKLAIKYPNANTSLKALVDGGQIPHYLFSAQSSADIDSLSVCVFCCLKQNPDLSGIPPRVGNSANGVQTYNSILITPTANEELLGKLVDLSLEFTTMDNLCTTAKSIPKSMPYIMKIFENVINRVNGQKYFGANLIIGEYSFLKSNLNENIFEKLLEECVKTEGLIQEIIKNQFNIAHLRLYKNVYPFAKTEKVFREFLISGFKTIDKDFWTAQLNEEGPLIEFLTVLVEDRNEMGLTISLEDALLTHANGLITGVNKKGRLFNNWNSVLASLDDSTRKIFYRRLMDLVCKAQTTSQPLIEFYGDQLIDEELIKGTSKNSL